MLYKTDEFDFDEPFEVSVMEDNNPDRPYINVYIGLMKSLLFDGYEKMLIIYLMRFSDTSETDCINTSTISVNDICKKAKMSKTTVYNRIKQLEKKGVLVKQYNNTLDSGKMANTYRLLNYASVWDCETLEELKEITDEIKKEALLDG